MTRWLLLAAALGLAGCTGARPPTDQEQCERQADDDPVVRDMRMKAAGSPTYLAEEQTAIRGARQDALLRCLRGRGIIRPGGVERQRPL